MESADSAKHNVTIELAMRGFGESNGEFKATKYTLQRPIPMAPKFACELSLPQICSQQNYFS